MKAADISISALILAVIMKSIAKILGVSESRVSQIHSKTLLKMRQGIGPM